MSNLDFIEAQLKAEQDRAADLAERCQLLLYILETATEAVTYETEKAQYTGTRLSAPMAKLGDAVRLLGPDGRKKG